MCNKTLKTRDWVLKSELSCGFEGGGVWVVGRKEGIGVKRADWIWKGRLDGGEDKEWEDRNWLEDRRLGRDFLRYVGCCISCVRSQYFYEPNSQDLEGLCWNGVYWRHRASLTANQRHQLTHLCSLLLDSHFSRSQSHTLPRAWPPEVTSHQSY